MIIVFLGRPESGKGTQSTMLGKELGLPVFAMGDLIREARVSNGGINQAYEQYAMRGRHFPNSIKFPLLKSRLDETGNGFILDNYPATKEDVETLSAYLNGRSLSIDKVFHITISEDEVIRRTKVQHRDRLDDDESVIRERLKNQDEDRKLAIDYFRNKGVLVEIDGEREITAIHGEIMSKLGVSQKEKNGL